MADVQKAPGNKGRLTDSEYDEPGGLYQQLQVALKGLLTVFGAAIALVLGVAVALTSGLLHPSMPGQHERFTCQPQM